MKISSAMDRAPPSVRSLPFFASVLSILDKKVATLPPGATEAASAPAREEAIQIIDHGPPQQTMNQQTTVTRMHTPLHMSAPAAGPQGRLGAQLSGRVEQRREHPVFASRASEVKTGVVRSKEERKRSRSRSASLSRRLSSLRREDAVLQKETPVFSAVDTEGVKVGKTRKKKDSVQTAPNAVLQKETPVFSAGDTEGVKEGKKREKKEDPSSVKKAEPSSAKKEEPSPVKKEDSATKKAEPAAKKAEPSSAKKEEPSVKKAEPAAKKEESSVKKAESAAKKEDMSVTDMKLSCRRDDEVIPTTGKFL